MKKISDQELKTVARRIDTHYANATDQDKTNGIAWYKTANDFCVEVAEQFNTTPIIVAGVISALSPRNRWEQNLKDAIQVLRAVRDSIPPDQIKVCTFNKNKLKAFQIARGEVNITDKSLKTYSFVNNIALLSEDHITVDVWHLRACFGKTVKTVPGTIAYKQIEQLTIKKAKQYGYTGYEFQAIVWNVVRTNKLR
jgi:hypothetical protein